MKEVNVFGLLTGFEIKHKERKEKKEKPDKEMEEKTMGREVGKIERAKFHREESSREDVWQRRKEVINCFNEEYIGCDL